MTVRIVIVCGNCGGDEFEVLETSIQAHKCVRCGLVFVEIEPRCTNWMRNPY